MNKQQLINTFDLAKQLKSGVGILVTVPTQEGLETIMNPYENLDYKLNYYLKTYEEIDNKLVLSADHDIEIQGVFCADTDFTDNKELCNFKYSEYGETFEEIFLGKQVEDSLTGLRGWVTGINYDLDGTINAIIEYLYSGEIKRIMIDADRLDLIEEDE